MSISRISTRQMRLAIVSGHGRRDISLPGMGSSIRQHPNDMKTHRSLWYCMHDGIHRIARSRALFMHESNDSSDLLNAHMLKSLLGRSGTLSATVDGCHRGTSICASTGNIGAAASSEDGNSTEKVDAARQLRVGAYVLGWYAFNIIFNILNKSMLNVFPAPWFLSAFQLGASALFMCVLWATNLHPAPRVTGDLVRALIPVAFFHTVGHVSACVSFSQMAVSFTHVVKAAEPVMSVILAQGILKETYPFYVWASLLPIIAGCSLSAMKEVSFSWAGFNNAMLSNIGMVLRNIYSKKYLDQFKHIDGINMFALLSIISIAYTLPAALVMEGFAGGTYQWGQMASTAIETLGSTEFFRLMAGTGIFYHLYNQASYMVLGQGISPVTFSVGNTMKRVAVVVASVIFFRNPVSPLNWIGSIIALLGTGLYSIAKQRAAQEKSK